MLGRLLKASVGGQKRKVGHSGTFGSTRNSGGIKKEARSGQETHEREGGFRQIFHVTSLSSLSFVRGCKVVTSFPSYIQSLRFCLG